MNTKSKDEALADALSEVHYLDRIAYLVEHPKEYRTLKWLEEALQSAVSVEFSTIPPYLCALWSIQEENHEVAESIRNVVQEEMLHMALACNMLTAIGYVPKINQPNMVPRYPGKIPGGVHPELTVSLSGLSAAALDAFIAIEAPSVGDPPKKPEEGKGYKTIGAFYYAILDAFQTLKPELSTERQIAGPLAYMVMEDLAGVEAAIALILEQGEGSVASPDVAHTKDLAHYYRFLEVKHCRRINPKLDANRHPVFDGPELPRPEVWPMAKIPKGGYRQKDLEPKVWKMINGFDQTFTQLLDRLQVVWEYGDQGALVHAIERMFGLTKQARALMEIKIPDGGGATYGPCFRYLEKKKTKPGRSAPMTKGTKNTAGDKQWHVIRTVVLGAPAATVWNVIGGFYTIHEWHPDISKTEIPADQTQTRQLRRILTFPGQPTTTEELVSMDNDDFHYRYKWYHGQWGEKVKNYQAFLRVLSGDLDKTCIVQWESTFQHPTDAISDFYLNGFRELEIRFPVGNKEQ